MVTLEEISFVYATCLVRMADQVIIYETLILSQIQVPSANFGITCRV